MINWERSKQEFGTAEPKRKAKIIVVCDTCGFSMTSSIRRLKDIVDGQMAWRCHKCATHTDEYKAKKAAATKEAWSDPNYRQKLEEHLEHQRKIHRSVMQAAISSESTKEKIRQFNRRDYEPITRMKMAENLKLHWKNDDFRTSVSEHASDNLKKRWEDEKFRQFISHNSKKSWENPEYRAKITASLRASRILMPRTSHIQKTLYSILDDLGIRYFREYEDKPADPECVIGPYAFDCVIPALPKTLLIECQGDYWHSIPKIVSNDKRKASYMLNFPEFEVKYLWEHEFKCKDKIVELLKYWLNITQLELVDFSFNDIEIRLDCPPDDYRLLLAKYHYLPNAGNGGISYGAYHNNELVAVCIFSPLARQNLPFDAKTTRELSRLCIHPRYQKKNFASWFVSRCIAQLDKKYKTVISYCDTTFNHNGAVYKACNFTLDATVKPDYWYASQDGWVMHKRTLYGHAVRMHTTEAEYAIENGYTKVYGKEKLRFRFDR
jgi:GNAT superfamily N-acetyltransferase